MVKALVTGGTGFLGSHIARTLVEAGHTARVLRRTTSSLKLLEELPVEHAIGDVMDSDSLDAAMDGCEWVFHVAAVADYWRANRIKLYLVNVNGTINVLNAARRAGVRRVIFTSSGAAIGMRKDGRPADESVMFNLSPNQFPYGHSKHLAELEIQRAVAQGQDVVILNPAIVYGPGDLNLISGSMITELAGGKMFIYPDGGATVIDVRDVADAHLAAAERGRSGERYLLGAVDMSHKALLKLIADVVGAPPPTVRIPAYVTPLLAAAVGVIRQAGMTLPIDANQIRLSARNVYFDCHKAWRELGEPKVDLRQSLKDTYRWYVEQGVIK
ncbi:MAG: SDR family oxidoreductase [Anaerolineae bacterium]|nr:SDR family oxidoreductase [Anaerolineae bacterium]